MQSVGTILWKVKTDFFRLFSCSNFATLATLSVMIIIILPALGSEAFATDPAAPKTNDRVTAVASAQVLKPFTTNSTMQAGTSLRDSAITVSRRTAFRNCETLLGSDANQLTGATCELRLIELQ